MGDNSFWLGATESSRLTGYGVICLVGVLFGLGLLWPSRRFPLDDALPTPGIVRGAFVFFIVALDIFYLFINRSTRTATWRHAGRPGTI